MFAHEVNAEGQLSISQQRRSEVIAACTLLTRRSDIEPVCLSLMSSPILPSRASLECQLTEDGASVNYAAWRGSEGNSLLASRIMAQVALGEDAHVDYTGLCYGHSSNTDACILANSPIQMGLDRAFNVLAMVLRIAAR